VKRRIIVSTLLAVILLLIPSTALAGDPPDTEVNIEVNAGGDLEVNLEGQANGDAEYNMYGDGTWNINDKGLDAYMGDIAQSAIGDGGDDWMWIAKVKEIYPLFWELYYKVGNDMTHDIWAVADATFANWQTGNWLGVGIRRNKSSIEDNVRDIGYNTNQIASLIEMDKQLAKRDDTMMSQALANESRIKQLEAQLYQAEQRANMTAIAVGIVLAILIGMAIAFGRLRHKVHKYMV